MKSLGSHKSAWDSSGLPTRGADSGHQRRTSSDVQTPARMSYSLADDEYNLFIYPRFCCFFAII